MKKTDSNVTIAQWLQVTASIIKCSGSKRDRILADFQFKQNVTKPQSTSSPLALLPPKSSWITIWAALQHPPQEKTCQKDALSSKIRRQKPAWALPSTRGGQGTWENVDFNQLWHILSHSCLLIFFKHVSKVFPFHFDLHHNHRHSSRSFPDHVSFIIRDSSF